MGENNVNPSCGVDCGRSSVSGRVQRVESINLKQPRFLLDSKYTPKKPAPDYFTEPENRLEAETVGVHAHAHHDVREGQEGNPMGEARG